MTEWFRAMPIWLFGLLLLIATGLCAVLGAWARDWFAKRPEDWGRLSQTQQGYVITNVYTLLGLLIGFTFSFAIDRYEVRTQLVVQDAKAIGTLYLESQMLPEPHRSQMSALLIRYAQNHLELGQTHRNDVGAARLLVADDLLQRELWTTVIPAFQSVRTIDFSSVFVQSAVELGNVDIERRALRRAAIPTTIVAVLLFYSLVAAGVLGAVMKSRKGQQVSIALMLLYVIALMLVTDLNRPVEGTIRESQGPMRQLLTDLRANPPSAYQKPGPAAAPALSDGLTNRPAVRHS